MRPIAAGQLFQESNAVRFLPFLILKEMRQGWLFNLDFNLAGVTLAQL